MFHNYCFYQIHDVYQILRKLCINLKKKNVAAQKIHCSAETKNLLDRLGGYNILERGYIDIKGKGEILTYFLESEDITHRTQRRSVREKRRHSKETVYHRAILRSSLKATCSLSRAASFESSKRLRFSNKNVEYNNSYEIAKLESVVDSSPSKCLTVDFCDHLSVSCPCIENVQNRVNGEKLIEANSDPLLTVMSDQICTPLLYKIESRI